MQTYCIPVSDYFGPNQGAMITYIRKPKHFWKTFQFKLRFPFMKTQIVKMMKMNWNVIQEQNQIADCREGQHNF